jgi:hypothetical protein
VLAADGARIAMARALLVVMDALVEATAHLASSTLVPDVEWIAVVPESERPMTDKT